MIPNETIIKLFREELETLAPQYEVNEHEVQRILIIFERVLNDSYIEPLKVYHQLIDEEEKQQ